MSLGEFQVHFLHKNPEMSRAEIRITPLFLPELGWVCDRFILLLALHLHQIRSPPFPLHPPGLAEARVAPDLNLNQNPIPPAPSLPVFLSPQNPRLAAINVLC